MCIGDECDEGRRSFLTGAAGAVVGLAASNTIFAQTNQYKDAVTRVLDDPTITHGPVMFQHQKKDIIGGYLARPKADGKYPAVIVVAGNVISEEYIPNTCAALAVAGFVGLAPNIFHPPIGSPQRFDTQRDDQAGHSDDDALIDINIGIDYLRRQPFARQVGEFPFARLDGLGVVGFCYGGRLALLLGARVSDVDAVVAYHPGPFYPQEMTHLRGPVLVHQGTADHSLPEGQTATLIKNLKAQKIPVQDYWYEGADHGFLAYTRPTYKPDAAKLSWDRTVAFLKKNLGVQRESSRK
jgi:carboxymethylenebutenolidase